LVIIHKLIEEESKLKNDKTLLQKVKKKRLKTGPKTVKNFSKWSKVKNCKKFVKNGPKKCQNNE
jgi:hypothetical protein